MYLKSFIEVIAAPLGFKEARCYYVDCKYQDIVLEKEKLRRLVENCTFIVW